MYLADCHVHSRVSADAVHPMTEMAAAGLALGLNEMCFTEHVEPVNLWSQWEAYDRFPLENLEEEFASVQAAYGDRMKLRMGVELGDAFLDYDRTERIMAGAPPLDFIIGSVHVLPPEKYGHRGSASFRPENEAEARRSMADYLELAQKMADWGKFSVMGHLTLPQRYLTERFGFDVTFDGFEAEIASIFRSLIEKGVGIEVNTNRGHVPLPDAKWLRLYRSLGGEIVTLGSDAHRPQDVGCAVRERQELLRQCGYARFCTFERLRPVWHEL